MLRHSRTRGLAALLAVVFVLGSATPASAQWRRHRQPHRTHHHRGHPSLGLGFSIAAWEPNDINATDALVTGHVRLFLNDAWVIEPELGWWQHQDTFFDPSLGPTALRARDLIVGANLVYLHSVGHRSGVYMGGGVALHSWRLEQETQTTFDVLEDNGPGGHILAGIETRIARGTTGFVEGRYFFGRVDNFDSSGESLDFSGPSIGVGLNFYLP